MPFHGHLRCVKLLLTQINNKYLSSHLHGHGQIKIATYSCHIEIARVDGALSVKVEVGAAVLLLLVVVVLVMVLL